VDDQGPHTALLSRNAAYADLVNAYEREPAPDAEVGS
jgi:hypothetical protein